MQSIRTVKNQTLLDLSIQLYGTDQACWQIYLWNRGLFQNDGASLDMALPGGVQIDYDSEWPGENRIAKKEINGKIIATHATD